ncbi:hypothetical protein [Flammeovirga kamogawensis]|uniref:DUF3299 domain-containing protein n=1 Tax=Flammeovirga kamogawensis TaxID=373891 RepID=A0ABX8GQP1_9BACT|nr:hypothetical protein [Flammeovirga kamogawensis]MBB6462155.1 hypothetical protein [Flammeovirga kamogawensis]QWG05889.1 hypothetical protein KM029_10940 [Flammeovirga kamogawensis]TRX67713.1 hypothetical protein EO216_05950 [Flammeovirga kamogawensis]
MKLYFLSIITFFSIHCTAQNTSTDVWKTLSHVEMKTSMDETLGFEVSEPIFGGEVEMIDGSIITISGYILPVDSENGTSILSYMPFANCFFCGNAGPETVIELDMPKKQSLVNKKVTVKGRLNLNRDDFYSLIYKLSAAKVIDVEN